MSKSEYEIDWSQYNMTVIPDALRQLYTAADGGIVHVDRVTPGLFACMQAIILAELGSGSVA